ncbi:MAG: NAD(P)/FAD-dependent oxidoreductase [Coleofasciculus sp. G3-WIS-01]|uniref:NAD(P)/FAD-dependent oxidoreductase n=1 Tax=Coleofasciculus sp. G3-WIS-01 TaxID=3069528 RepID=UPI0032F09E80
MNHEPSIHICILGGGFGGLYTALYLQRFRLFKSPKYKITLIDRKDHLVFTPLLYERVTEELQAWEIAPRYRTLIKNTTVDFCQGTIQALDLEKRQVKLQLETLSESGQNLRIVNYDYLVLTVGAEMRLEGVPGAATYAYPFRTVTDAERLNQRLKQLEQSNLPQIRVAVIGAGPSGVELACKLSDRLQKRGQVRLIERGQQLLKTFTPYSQKSAYRALSARRVQMEFETSVEVIEADQITLINPNGKTIMPVDLVLWTVGTRSIEWVSHLPCQQNAQGKILTHPTLQVVDYPEVLALGDMAEIPDYPQLPKTAQVAYQQADCAAKNLYRAVRGKRLKPFRYLHLGEMLTLGKGEAVVSSFALKIRGPLAGIIRQFVYLQRLPTLRHRLRVLQHWVGQWLVNLRRQLAQLFWKRRRKTVR